MQFLVQMSERKQELEKGTVTSGGFEGSLIVYSGQNHPQEGYLTRELKDIREGGVNISGGRSQRASLAEEKSKCKWPEIYLKNSRLPNVTGAKGREGGMYFRETNGAGTQKELLGLICGLTFTQIYLLIYHWL